MSIPASDLLDPSETPTKIVNVNFSQSTDEPPTGIWSRLKAGTRTVHGRLDSRIMEGRPFESRERYGLFVLVQHDFHAIVSALYQHTDLAPLLPDLKERD